ncbi:hypothetical protein LTR08_007160 [Meristemomyces frigidus]|nr:hypothetical protein LTR08_007160 [Meristemomyces frigidus]
MNLQDSSSDWVYAYLQGPSINSDDMNAPRSKHNGEGGFQWDLSQATGGPDANPFIGAATNTTFSSSAGGAQSQTRLAQAHGALASLAFVAIYPIGAILVRLASFRALAWVHGGVQVFGYAVFVAAAGLGIFIANRDDYLREPHAIIGMLLLGILFFVPLMGIIHHNMYKTVQRRTMWSYGHIFTGRVGIVLGMINGGLGLQLAKAGGSYTTAYGVFAGLIGAIYITTIVFAEFKRVGESSKDTPASSLASAEPKGLDREASGSTADQ